MQQLLKILRFASWPIIYGLLVAIVYLQYQKLSELSQQVAEIPEVRELLTNTTSFAEAIKKAAPSVVSINATSVNVESVERAAEDRVNLYLGERDSLGSGVIISEQGFILTNLHVVDTLFDAFDTEVTISDGRRTPATVVAWDKGNDLAVLHINMDNLAPIKNRRRSAARSWRYCFCNWLP